MSALLDIIAAGIIGAVLMLMVLTATDNAVQTFVNNNIDAITQLNLSTTTAIIQNDLRRVGYGIPESQQGNILQIAETHRVKYLVMLNSADSIPDTISYTIFTLDTLPILDTFIVRFGVRRDVSPSNASSSSTVVGVTSNSTAFRYLNQIGGVTAVRSSIRMVEVTLIEVNPSVYMSREMLVAGTKEERMVEAEKVMKESFWRQTRVISKNLRR